MPSLSHHLVCGPKGTHGQKPGFYYETTERKSDFFFNLSGGLQRGDGSAAAARI